VCYRIPTLRIETDTLMVPEKQTTILVRNDVK
jgi:hypothetical protein